MSAAFADFLIFNVVLIGVGLLMLVVGVDKRALAWRRRRCRTCGREHQGGCRRYEL